MSKIKKTLCFLLCMTMVLTVSLTGCKKTSDTAVTPNAASLKPYNIVYYVFADAQSDNSAVEKAIGDYLKDKINATITLNELGTGDYNTKMSVIVSSGQKFDLCFTAGGTLDYPTYAVQGAFKPLTSTKLLDKYGSGIKKTIPSDLIAGCDINGELYALPTNKSYSIQMALALNTDLLKKYNLSTADIEKATTPLAKLKAAEPMLKTIHDNEKNAVAFIPSEGVMGPIFNTISNTAALYVNNSTTTVFNKYASNDFKEFVQLMRSWYTAGYIPADVATNAVSSKTVRFMENVQYSPYQETQYTDGCTTIAKLSLPWVTGAKGREAMTAISATSANPERAMMFLNLLYTDKDLENLMLFGVKDKDYTLDSKNHLDYIKSSDGKTALFSLQNWTQGTLYNSYLVGASTPDDKWAKYKEKDSTAQKCNTIGFSYDPSNVTTAISAITNVVKQYDTSLYCGSVDPTVYLPKFVSALNDAGAKTLNDDVQKQFDKFLKSSSSKSSK